MFQSGCNFCVFVQYDFVYDRIFSPALHSDWPGGVEVLCMHGYSRYVSLQFDQEVGLICYVVFYNSYTNFHNFCLLSDSKTSVIFFKAVGGSHYLIAIVAEVSVLRL